MSNHEVIVKAINLNNWIITNNGILHRENYSIVVNSEEYTIVKPDGTVINGDAAYPLFTAIEIVNNLLEP